MFGAKLTFCFLMGFPFVGSAHTRKKLSFLTSCWGFLASLLITCRQWIGAKLRFAFLGAYFRKGVALNLPQGTMSLDPLLGIKVLVQRNAGIERLCQDLILLLAGEEGFSVRYRQCFDHGIDITHNK